MKEALGESRMTMMAPVTLSKPQTKSPSTLQVFSDWEGGGGLPLRCWLKGSPPNTPGDLQGKRNLKIRLEAIANRDHKRWASCAKLKPRSPFHPPVGRRWPREPAASSWLVPLSGVPGPGLSGVRVIPAVTYVNFSLVKATLL